MWIVAGGEGSVGLGCLWSACCACRMGRGPSDPNTAQPPRTSPARPPRAAQHTWSRQLASREKTSRRARPGGAVRALAMPAQLAGSRSRPP